MPQAVNNNDAFVIESPDYETLTSTVSLPEENSVIPENIGNLLSLIESNMNFNELGNVENKDSRLLKYSVQSKDIQKDKNVPKVIKQRPTEIFKKITTIKPSSSGSF